MRVTYYDKDGSSVIYVGGNRTWRNQNPGNIGAGAWAKRHGAIGSAGGFAVFPNYEIGRAALLSWWSTSDHRGLSIWDAIPVYAPAKENDVAWYRKVIRQASKLDLDRKVKNLSPHELELLLNAVERAEGKFKPGQVIGGPKKKQIISVKKNKKGTIYKYQVESLGWLSKARAIDLTAEGVIDAVVAYSRAGNPYLRSRPDRDGANNLEDLG